MNALLEIAVTCTPSTLRDIGCFALGVGLTLIVGAVFLLARDSRPDLDSGSGLP